MEQQVEKPDIVEQLIPSQESDPNYRCKKALQRIIPIEIGLGTLAILLSLATLIVSPQSILEGVLLHQGLNRKGYSFIHSLQGVWSGVALIICGVISTYLEQAMSKQKALVQIIIILGTVGATFAALILSVLAAASLTADGSVVSAVIHAALAVLSILGVTIAIIHSRVVHSTIYSDTRDVMDRPSDCVVEQRHHLPEHTNNQSMVGVENSTEFDTPQHGNATRIEPMYQKIKSSRYRTAHDVCL